ncbi:MAG: hypothetical protein K0S09_2206 [Sphingobacteriaceae bacterium]|jgi:hypothetical protein|nr:hypothetical protein [Sphingobacteriaceae bacterium]
MLKTSVSVLLLISALIISSCCKAIIEMATLFTNSSPEKVELIGFENANRRSLLVLNPAEARQANWDLLFSPLLDSVQVFYGNKIQSVHYSSKITTINNAKAIKSTDQGNLFNPSGYTAHRDDKKCSSYTTYTYTFF